MGDLLDRVRKAMGEVIHRIDTPFVTCSIVRDSLDSIKDRISHKKVW